MKKAIILLILFFSTGCYWHNPLEFLEPLENGPVPSNYVIQDNNYELLGTVQVKESEWRILLSIGPVNDGLYNNAMKSLKNEADLRFGSKIGFINITKDELYEAFPFPAPVYHLLPFPLYTKKSVILSADIIRYK